MSTDKLLRAALEAGIEIRLADGKIKVSGCADVVMAWAPRLREHKAALIEHLIESSRLTHELLEAAMRACDHHGDGPEARAQMKRECLETPPHLKPGLLEHFRRNYPG